jgi:hypothetical protein
MRACSSQRYFTPRRAGKAARPIENPGSQAKKFIFCLPTGSRLALKAHQALGFRGVMRAGFRCDDRRKGTGAVLRRVLHTQPGVTETSLRAERAARASRHSMS